MKIQITTQKPDEVQRFFSAPLSFSQMVTVKKLLIVEQILERMKALGLNRSKLAARMEISPARVTTMMDGTNNFTIETLMRAADAVDGELALTIIPKGHQVTAPSQFSASSGFTKPSKRKTARRSSESPPPPFSAAPAAR